MRSEMPSRRGTEKPQMSASSTPTVWPASASAAARLTVTELLPTPPLPLAMASTLQRQRDLGVRCVLAGVPAGLGHHLAALVGVHLAPRDLHVGDAGMHRDLALDLALDLGAQGAPTDGELDADGHEAVGCDVDRRHHAERHDVGPSSGSITVASAAITSSCVGGSQCRWSDRVDAGMSGILPAEDRVISWCGSGTQECVPPSASPSLSGPPQLDLLKALGDNTRYAIYLELARSARPLATADISESLDLHPNTVRPHLERMREAGLLDVEVGGRGDVGRPQHRYSIAAERPLARLRTADDAGPRPHGAGDGGPTPGERRRRRGGRAHRGRRRAPSRSRGRRRRSKRWCPISTGWASTRSSPTSPTIPTPPWLRSPTAPSPTSPNTIPNSSVGSIAGSSPGSSPTWATPRSTSSARSPVARRVV